MEYEDLILDEINKLKEDYSVMDMSAVRRYNNGNKFLNRHENVAEHSTHVALNVIILCDILQLPDEMRYKAVTWAVVHDISEPVSADLPYEFKTTAPQVFNDQFEAFELSQVWDNYPHFYSDFSDFTASGHKKGSRRPIERILVDLADALVVRQYAKLEMDMGNKTSEVEKFYKLADIRIQEHTKHLISLL